MRVRGPEHHRVGQHAGVVRAHDPRRAVGERAVEQRLVDCPLVPLVRRRPELDLSHHAHARRARAEVEAQRLVVARDHLRRAPSTISSRSQERHALRPLRRAHHPAARHSRASSLATVASPASSPSVDERDHARGEDVVRLVHERVVPQALGGMSKLPIGRCAPGDKPVRLCNSRRRGAATGVQVEINHRGTAPREPPHAWAPNPSPRRCPCCTADPSGRRPRRRRGAPPGRAPRASSRPRTTPVRRRARGERFGAHRQVLGGLRRPPLLRGQRDRRPDRAARRRARPGAVRRRLRERPAVLGLAGEPRRLPRVLPSRATPSWGWRCRPAATSRTATASRPPGAGSAPSTTACGATPAASTSTRCARSRSASGRGSSSAAAPRSRG